MLLYQIKNGMAAVLGSSHCGVVEIPEKIDGKPVTELAPYAFSEGWGRREMLKAAGEILFADSEGNALAEGGKPDTCCGELEEIILPSGIRKIGNYAFYNCHQLNTIRCWSTMEDVGSGLFTGCTGVKNMEIHIVPGRRSCFKELISELRQELSVDYYEERKPALKAKLIFPEMFEESVENTPARIIVREMHGCGHMYRYAFDQTAFQFRKYDALFPHVIVQEPERVVSSLVMGRLRFPFELADQYRSQYEAYLREHVVGAAKITLERGDTEQLIWLAEHYAKEKETMEKMIELANQKECTEALGYLMDLKHRRFAPKRRSFSL